MELAVAWRVLRVYGWLALLFGLIGLLVAGVYTVQQTPVYVSQSRLIVGLQTSGTASPNDRVNANNFASQTAATYAQVVSSSQVLQQAISALKITATPQSLAEMVNATSVVDSPIITVQVKADSPSSAAALGDAVTKSFQNYVVTVLEPPVSSTSTNKDKSTITVAVLQAATVPTVADSPKPLVNLGLGLLAGLLIGAAVALVLALTDKRLRTVGEVERVIGRPVLGVLGLAATGSVASADAVLLDEPLRAIRTNYTFVAQGRSGMVSVVASSKSGEGAVETVVGLAKAFAEIGARVVVVEADFASPRLAPMFGLSGDLGLVDVLTRGAELVDVVQPSDDPLISVLAEGGAGVENPSRLLGSGPMALVVDELRAGYDVVLFSVPPLLVAADAAMLSTLVGGVVVVAGSGRVTAPELSSAIDSLSNLEVSILGVVMTRRSLRRRRSLETSSEALARIAPAEEITAPV